MISDEYLYLHVDEVEGSQWMYCAECGADIIDSYEPDRYGTLEVYQTLDGEAVCPDCAIPATEDSEMDDLSRYGQSVYGGV